MGSSIARVFPAGFNLQGLSVVKGISEIENALKPN
jgi:hypothetical protein